MEPAFYMAAAVFILALLLLVFSIRKYLEIKNNSDFEEGAAAAEGVQGELPLTERSAEDTGPWTVPEALRAREDAAPAPAAGTSEVDASRAPSRAEEFVKGLYDHLANLDARMRNIEADFSKSRINRDFTTKFLEDMVADFDSLDKTKIKSRIEYLLTDLRK
jgi:hypothetical protein